MPFSGRILELTGATYTPTVEVGDATKPGHWVGSVDPISISADVVNLEDIWYSTFYSPVTPVQTSPITFNISNPGLITTSTPISLAIGDEVVFTGVSAGSTITGNTTYYVYSIPSSTSFTVSTTQSVKASNYYQIGVVGDSLTYMNGNGPTLITSNLVNAGWTQDNIEVTGVYGMRIFDDTGGSAGNYASSLSTLNGISAVGKGTTDIITAYRAAGFDPRVWLIALGTNNQLSGSGGPSTQAPEIQDVIDQIMAGPAGNYVIYWMELAYGPGSDRTQYVAGFTTTLGTFVGANFITSPSYTTYLAGILANVGATTYQTYWDSTDTEDIHNTDLGYQVVRAPFYAETVAGAIQVVQPLIITASGSATGITITQTPPVTPPPTQATVKFAVSSPGLITTNSAHGLVVGDSLTFTGVVGGLPIVTAATYWVVTVPSSTTFTVATTSGGSAIAITSVGTAISFTITSIPTPPVGGVLGAQKTIARKPADSTHVPVEDIDTGGVITNGVWVYGSGMSLQSIITSSLAKGKIITFPAATFNWSGFSQGNSFIGVAFAASQCLGFSGSGYNTIFAALPNTISETSYNQRTNANSNTTALFQMNVSGITGMLFENCRFEYAEQAYLGNAALFHGFNVLNSPSCTFFNIWANGFGVGNAAVNPGETFIIGTNGASSLAITQCTIDGRPLGTGTAVSGSNIGFNQGSPNCTITNTITQNAGAGHGVTSYEGSGAYVYTNVASINNADDAWNNEKYESGYTLTMIGCQSYGNGGSGASPCTPGTRMILDSEEANATVAIHDHILSAGGTASVGVMCVRVDPYHDGTAAGDVNQQKMSSVTYYNNGTVDNHFMYNDKAPAPGNGALGYYG